MANTEELTLYREIVQRIRRSKVGLTPDQRAAMMDYAGAEDTLFQDYTLPQLQRALGYLRQHHIGSTPRKA